MQIADNIKSALSSYTQVSFAEFALDKQADHLAWRFPKVDLAATTCIWIGDDDQTFFNLSVSLSGKWPKDLEIRLKRFKQLTNLNMYI